MLIEHHALSTLLKYESDLIFIDVYIIVIAILGLFRISMFTPSYT